MNEITKLIFEACNENKIVLKNPNINLFETGLLDSMGFLELLTIIEEEFEIEIDPADATKEKMATPKAIYDYVIEKAK